MTDSTQLSDRARQILDAVNFELTALKHPVEVLTIEAASELAGVSASTVTSGVNGVEDFRHRVLAQTILRLDATPSPVVWNAVQQSILAKHGFVNALGLLIDVTSRELAKDRAFPFVVGTYAPTPTLLDHLDVAIDRYVGALSPLVTTLGAACGQDLREIMARPQIREALWIIISAASLEPLLLREDCWADEHRTRPFAHAFDVMLRSSEATTIEWDDFPATSLPRTVHWSASLSEAVQAGSDLLMSNRLTPNADLTVAEICRRSGIGVSAFYRGFGSTDEFNRIAIGEAGRRARAAYIDSFNKAITATGKGPHSDWDSLLGRLIDVYVTQSNFDQDKRVDSPLWPWVNTEPATRSLREFIETTSQERATIYAFIAEQTGRVFNKPFDASRASWLLTSLGGAGNIERHRHLTRPDHHDATSKILGVLLRALIEPVSVQRSLHNSA